MRIAVPGTFVTSGRPLRSTIGPRGDVVADHEVEDELAERGEDGDDGDGDERRVAPVATGRLAVAADPVAGDGEDEGRQPERPEVGGVEDEAGAEPSGRAE